MAGGDMAGHRVADALWRAFPEAVSEHDLAERAAPYFRRADGSAVDPRTVRYWLSGTSRPSFGHLLTLIAMVGADFFDLPRAGCRA